METLHFNTLIDAPREKVWDVLWNEATYGKWAAEFMEGSYAVTDWKEGSKALFLSPGGDGMVSTIAANKPYEFMSIRHLGTVKNGVEDLDSEETMKWAGAMENYQLTDVNGKTELNIDMDITDEYRDYFTKVWPKALEKVKELAE